LNESGVLDSQRLTIIPGKLLWKIQMDISIEQVGGGLIDLCMLAARTALWDTRIPKLHIETLSDGVFEYSIDEHLEEQSMIIESIPLSVTLHKFDKYFCADCSLEEEECSEGFVTVAVDSNGSIYAVKKGGDKGIQPAIMTEMIQAAKKIAQEKVMSHDLFLENSVRAL
jgi:exosome complex component RRP42